MKQLMTFYINGKKVEYAVEPNMTLVDLLREELGLTGTKKGCNEGDCGACTVLLNDKAVASCTTLAAQANGKRITTVEGLRQGNQLNPVQQAFIDNFAVQCGFCTPGMIMSAISLLKENPDPTEEEIRDALRGNLCRCTGYVKIIDAVNDAAKRLREKLDQN